MRDLAALTKQLEEKLKERPIMPSPFFPHSKEANAWSKAFEKWVDEVEPIRTEITLAKVEQQHGPLQADTDCSRSTVFPKWIKA